MSGRRRGRGTSAGSGGDVVDRVWDWIGLLFGVAIVYVLVRPGSQAGKTVEGMGNLIAALVRRAVDLAAPTT